MAWEGTADLSRFIQDVPLGKSRNVVLQGSDVVAVAYGKELFANYGGEAYWGKRLREVVKCAICQEDEWFESKLVQCAVCGNHTHCGCLQACVETHAIDVQRTRAPHRRMDERLPRCCHCREPWPQELTGRMQCSTPGCTHPAWHSGPHSSEPELRRRRSETHEGY